MDTIERHISFVDLLSRDDKGELYRDSEGKIVIPQNLACRCPFHGGSPDSTAFSITINPFPVQATNEETLKEKIRGVYHCWSCGESGPIRKGILEAKNAALYQSSTYKTSPKVIKVIPDDISQVLERVFEIYQEEYKKNFKARGYLVSRGIHPEIVGFCPGGSLLQEAGLPIDLLKQLALVRDDGRDTMWNRIILPFTWKDKLSCLYGRSILSNIHKDGRHRKTGTLQGSFTQGVYNESVLNTQRVIITEAPFDAIAFEELKGTKASALGGTFNNAVIDRLQTVEKIYMATDSDDPGNQACARVMEMYGDKVKRLAPPKIEGIKDWTDMAQQRAEKQREIEKNKIKPSPKVEGFGV